LRTLQAIFCGHPNPNNLHLNMTGIATGYISHDDRLQKGSFLNIGIAGDPSHIELSDVAFQGGTIVSMPFQKVK
jgi:hypothetical protein